MVDAARSGEVGDLLLRLHDCQLEIGLELPELARVVIFPVRMLERILRREA